MGVVHYLRDSLTNLITGIGSSKDPRMAAQYIFAQLSKDQLEAAYRGDWVARKIVNAPAEDATREWREWQASAKQIEALEEGEKNFDLQRQLKRALIKARLYGGSAIVMGVANQGMSDVPLEPEKVKKGDLKYIATFHQFELNAGQRIWDIESPWFGQPEYYTIASSVQNIDDKQIASGVRIHPSRVIQLSGNEMPDWNIANAANIWGDSVLQVVDETLKSTGTVVGGIATMIADAKMDVISIPNLTAQLSDETLSAKLIKRFTLANQAKSTVNSLLLDEKEKWERITTNFASLPQLLQEYLTLAAGAAGIPLSRLVGMAKGKGLGGSEGGGEVDTRNYYDGISSTQRTELSPTLAALDNVFIASTLGSVDPSIFYDWRPLWQMSDAEKADIAVKKSQVMTADVGAQLINPDALREARINQLNEDGTYPGLDKAVEELGAEPPEPETPSPEDLNAHIGMLQKSAGQLQQLGKAAVQPNNANAQDAWSDAARAAALAARQGNATTKQKLIISYNTTQNEIAAIREELKNTSDPNDRARLRAELKAAQDDLALMGRAVAKIKDSLINDAEPRSLYVRRDVLNADEIIRWAKAQGFETTLPADEMHVTVTYSRNKVDWMAMGDDYLYDNDGKLKVVSGGPRMLDRFGLEKDCVVLLFNHWNLKYRHDQMVERGASWDWPEYQPHITISFNVPQDFDLDSIEPYTGPIDLGPEIFEEVKEDWKAGLTEDAFNPNQPRDKDGKWASGGGESADNAKGPEQLKSYLNMTSKYSATSAFVAKHGREYKFDASSFEGPRDTPKLCYMNAGRIAMNDSSRTYVEGFIDFHGVPIQHAWTIDKSGKVHDTTLRDGKGINAYYGVPFNTDYVMKTALKTKVWGIMSHTNPSLFKEKNTKSFLADFDPNQPRDKDGKWSETGAGGDHSNSTTPSQDLLALHHDDEHDTFDNVLAQLTPEQKAAMARAEDSMKDLKPTNVEFVGPDGKYTPERAKLQAEILNDKIFTKDRIAAAVPKNGEKPVLTLTGGRPAAGKTSALRNELGDTAKNSFYISADEIQEHLPGYTGEHAGIFNGEAQDMALQAEKIAREHGLNITYDATLKSTQPAHDRVDMYKAAGYDVNGYFVHTSPTTSAVRSAQRFMTTGRYVPPIVSFKSRTNEKTFDSLIPKLKKWAVYDNNGAKPKRIAGSKS